MAGTKKFCEEEKYLVLKLWYSAWATLKIKIDGASTKYVDELQSYQDFMNINFIEDSWKSNKYKWIREQILLLIDKSRNNDKAHFIEIDYDIEQISIDYDSLKDLHHFLHSIIDYNDEILSKDTLQKYHNCLIKILNKRTFAYCWFINNISKINQKFAINKLIQDIYMDALQKIIKEQRDNETVRILLCILSSFELPKEKENEMITWLYPMLNTINLSKEIELALYSRKNSDYLNRWHVFLDEQNSRLISPNDLQNANNIVNNIFLPKFKAKKSQLCIGDVTLRVIQKHTHWILDILDIGLIYLQNEEYEKISEILNQHNFQILWFPLLFYYLKNMPHLPITENLGSQEVNWNICKSLRYILQRIGEINNELDICFIKKNNNLSDCLDVAEWILNQFKNKNQLLVDSTLSVKLIIDLFQDFGILSTLKKCVDVNSLNLDDLELLLEKNQDALRTFQCFKSIQIIIKLITNEKMSNQNEDYFISFSNYVKETRQIINSLMPFAIRMEVMENIFSLLFLRYDHHFHTNELSCEDEVIITEKDKQSSTNESKDSCSDKDFGFICSSYITRELLLLLKQCILQMEVDFNKFISMNDCLENDNDLSSLESTIICFKRSVTDALWRLELLTNCDFVDQKYNITEKSKKILQEKSLNEKLSFSFHLTTKCIFYNQLTDNSSDEYEKQKKTSDRDASSQNNYLDNQLKRKKRVKNINENPISNYNSGLIINLMLSSKESLILQCLWKGDYCRAQQIIEIFNMKKSPLDGEVELSKALKLFRYEIIKPAIMNCCKTDKTFEDKNEENLLENIRIAAEGGYYNSRGTNKVERFLAYQEINAKLISSNSITRKEILTFCILDLALTVNQDFESNYNLLEIGIKHLRLCKELESTRYFEFFNNIFKLIYESKLKRPLFNLMCDASIPLSIQEWRTKNNFWKIVLENLKNFYGAQAEYYKMNTHERIQEITLKLNSCKYYHELVNLCSSKAKYFRNIYAYLQILEKILPVGNGPNVMTETDMLKIPLHYYFGHQIFHLGVQPNTLEDIAIKIGVNLIENILTDYCPRILYDDSICDIESIEMDNFNLNNIFHGSGDSFLKSSNEDVSTILTQLVSCIKNLYPGCSRIASKDLYDLSRNIEIQIILKKSVLLRNLDLSELSLGSPTLVFFLNLWNLLFLHGLISVWNQNPPMNSLRRYISLSSINYEIGDLGRVTLASLRSKLLGNLNWDTEYFLRSDDINEIAWQDLDFVQDYRVVFAMINEFFETPVLRVYHEETLDQDLNDSIVDFLNCYSRIEVVELDDQSNNDQIINIENFYYPEIFQRYENLEEKYHIDNDNDKPYFSLSKYLTEVKKIKDPVQICQSNTINYNILLNYDEKVLHCKSPMISPSFNSNISSDLITKKMNSQVLQYLEEHCWLLSYIVQRISKDEFRMIDVCYNNCHQTKCLENIFKSHWISILSKVLFAENCIHASLQENLTVDLWKHLESYIKRESVYESLDLIKSLPNKYLIKDTEIRILKDKLLCHFIVQMSGVLKHENLQKYIYQIKDINILTQLIINNVNVWPVELGEKALIHVLNHKAIQTLPSYCRVRITETLCRIKIFRKMLPHFQNRDFNFKEITWYDIVYCTDKTDPVRIIQSLIKADKFELCLEWLEYQSISLEYYSFLSQDLLFGLLKNDKGDFQNSLKLLNAIPLKQSIKICKAIFNKLNSTPAMKFIIQYILNNCKTEELTTHHKSQMGIEILGQLEVRDRCHYIELIHYPLIMLEQLLMNGKFEILKKILNILHFQEYFLKADIPMDNFDEIIRFYAVRSLDFRVSFGNHSTDARIKDLSISTNDIINYSRNHDFIMPLNTPTKNDWVPNHEARECSCCKEVVFSMFNRRHHCRRCGRVICAGCSQHRMIVPGYPESVLVRVCDDCKRQTILQTHATQGNLSSASSIAFDFWKLTTDENHNRSVREEFSFEYAPNISLCLSILSLHSDHKNYASFLLDRCHEMKKLLQPVLNGQVNPEIDHVLIIKMIRSLLIAVKVKCAKLGLNTGLAHCDQFLSQVDLIATLVQSDCLALIPSEDSLDEHALRKLRDFLIEKEQWTLALDVSTKSGLETQGVWAAWGKACLKVGYFERARKKFSYCLEKVYHESFEDWVLIQYPDVDTPIRNVEDTTKSQISSVTGESINWPKKQKIRPQKDPALLIEILNILEDQYLLNPDKIIPSDSLINSAQEILITLSNLKAVTQNKCSFVHRWDSKNIYYEESIYYLLTYGSYASILDFFVKYNEFSKCLLFTLENNIDPEIFFNSVYLNCLNIGNIEYLLDAMQDNDANLMAWKKYLVYTCHSLDKRQYLHSLYHLQLFMKDFIRAAMTCIRFYMNEARDYVDLCTKSQFLIDAQKHLEAELSISNLSKNRRKSITTINSGSSSSLTLEMEPSQVDKHINTISRQLEVAKFLGRAEMQGRHIAPFLQQLVDMDPESVPANELPTLFGNQQQKSRLAVLAILCGHDPEEGFGIAFRIMQDFNLRPQKIYSLAGHILALEKKINFIEKLIKCCRSSGAPDSSKMSDCVLVHCIRLLLQNSAIDLNTEFKDQIDSLMRLILDVEMKIDSYIESRQLKAAYLLAVKYQREQDITKILKEADRLGQIAIKSICTKWLKRMEQKNKN